MSPTQTHYFYQSAEGAIENLNPEGPGSPVGVRNLLVVKSEDSLVLTGTVSNQTANDYQVTLDVTNGASGTVKVEVPAGQSIQLGEGAGVELMGEAEAGTNVIIKFQAGSESKDVTVQVLDDSLEYLNNAN